MIRRAAAGRHAALLFLVLFLAYNANGREIGGSDTQPAKFAARALAERGTLTLDEDVRRAPPLAERAPFQLDRAGHYRSAYSPVASYFGAVTAWLLAAAGADLDAPRGANLIAVLTASSLTAAAVVLVFLTLVRLASTGVALAVAIGLGLGTNLWAVHSQTLGQHEVVAFGVALALHAWTRPDAALAARHGWIGAAGLALAVTARTQTAPLVAILALGLLSRAGWRRAAGPVGLILLAAAALAAVQWHWFGHPLGAVPRLEALHPEIHAVSGSISREPWIGAAGLLVSPNRGLFVFSPVALVAVAGLAPAWRRRREWGHGWLVAAALAQFAAYSLYTVWWGGHAYGPRYALDLVVPLTPAAALALTTSLAGRRARALCALALAWSMVVAATGAFFDSRWNTHPAGVDLNHERLWDWRDLQIVRSWTSGPSVQNFNLFNWTSVRREPPGGGDR